MRSLNFDYLALKDAFAPDQYQNGGCAAGEGRLKDGLQEMIETIQRLNVTAETSDPGLNLVNADFGHFAHSKIVSIV